MLKGSSKYDWEVLDKELIEVYGTDRNAVNKFSCKYGINIRMVYYRLRKLGIKTKYGIGKRLVNGYVMIYIGNGRYIAEHILVMEKKLGRELLWDEIVHHIDESFEGRSNNDDSNLQLVDRSDHSIHHRIGKGKRYSVCFDKWHGKWRLGIYDGNLHYNYAGLYKTKEEALKVVEHKYRLRISDKDKVI